MSKTWEEIAAETDRRSQRAFVLSGLVLTLGIVVAALVAGMAPPSWANAAGGAPSETEPVAATSDRG